MPDSPQDVYARHLLLSRRGYPLWTPEPSRRLPSSYLREGLRIGDVGVVVPDNGSFDVLFNICLPGDHPLHRRGVPDNFQHIALDSEDIDMFPNEENPGRVISDPQVEQMDPSGEGRSRINYDFRLPASEGALLILPQGAEHHDLRIKRRFLDEALQHAADWYSFAEQRLHRLIRNDSLYLITGHYKARSWGLASFPCMAHPGMFSVRFTTGGGHNGSSYTWTHQRPLDWRVGGPVDLDNGNPNQAVFISGFKIAVADELRLWKRITVEVDTGTEGRESNIVGRGSWLPKLVGGLTGSTNISAGSTPNMTTNKSGVSEYSLLDADGFTIVDRALVVDRQPKILELFHPSDFINRHLLSKDPFAKIAVTHDSDWMMMIDKGQLKVEDFMDDDQLEAAVRSTFHRVSEHGTTYLQRKSGKCNTSDSDALALIEDASPHPNDLGNKRYIIEKLPGWRDTFVNPESGIIENTPASRLPILRSASPSSETLDETESLRTMPLGGPTSTDEIVSTPDQVSLPSQTLTSGTVDDKVVIIAVMGLTGSGKSTFVNKAAGRTEVEIGNTLMSQTKVVQPVRFPHPDGQRDIILVDTPGFDDTHLSDAQILKIIAHWLKETYQQNIKLDGLLYLHRISDNRLGGTPLRNLSVFKDVCGDDNLKNVVLVTTMWDEIQEEEIGIEREEELLSNFWKDMIRLGSRTRRFAGTRDSAWEIIDCLQLQGSRESRAPLQIQREMVDQNLPLQETTAAKTLLRFLVQLIADLKKAWKKLRKGTRRSLGPQHTSEGQGRRFSLSRSPTFWFRSSKRSQSPVGVATPRSASPLSSPSTDTISPSGSASTRCSAAGRRDSLLATINGLRVARQITDLTSVPVPRGAIETALQIAQTIEGMGGTHHAVIQVIENAGWVLDEIAEYAVSSKLSKGTKKALQSFRKDLGNLQQLVNNISSREPGARFLLHDADFKTVTECTSSIKVICYKLEVKPTTDIHQVIARLDEQLTELSAGTIVRQCQCGMGINAGEIGENSVLPQVVS